MNLGSFRILLPFFRTSWGVGVLNSAIFNSFHNWVEFGTILEGLQNFGGGGGFEHPKPPPPPYATRAENHMLQLNIWCSWWWAYVPKTCRAKNTLIKLPCCIKLAFQIISWGRCTVKQPSSITSLLGKETNRYKKWLALKKNERIWWVSILFKKKHSNTKVGKFTSVERGDYVIWK